MTKAISAAEFKATCLEVLDTVSRTGHGIIVTKRGKPVVRVAPLVEKPKNIVGALRGLVTISGDLMSPIDADWDALKR